MKGKNLIILGAGAIGGFIGGNIFVLSKVVKSERMMEAIKDIVTDRITDVLFEDTGRYTNLIRCRIETIIRSDTRTIESIGVYFRLVGKPKRFWIICLSWLRIMVWFEYQIITICARLHHVLRMPITDGLSILFLICPLSDTVMVIQLRSRNLLI